MTTLVEECVTLSMAQVKCHLEPWARVTFMQFGVSITIDIDERASSVTINHKQRVQLATLPGIQGVQHFFLCPTCDRRCTKLYRQSGIEPFGCRVCLGLKYANQSESKRDRDWRRYHEMRRALFGSATTRARRQKLWPKFEALEARLLVTEKARTTGTLQRLATFAEGAGRDGEGCSP